MRHGNIGSIKEWHPFSRILFVVVVLGLLSFMGVSLAVYSNSVNAGVGLMLVFLLGMIYTDFKKSKKKVRVE